MKYLSIFSISLSLINPIQSINIEKRNYGGQPVNVSQYTYLAELVNINTTKLKCSGVMLDPYTLLTAAHCINDPINQLDINLPDPDKNIDSTKTWGLIYSGQAVTFAHGYDPKTRYADLAILKVHPFKDFFDPNKFPKLSLDQGDQFSQPGMELFSVGLSCDPSTNIESANFNKISLIIQPKDNCNSWTQKGFNLTDSIICTQQSNQGVNCNDEGGPLIYSKDGVNYLVGINSILSKENATTTPSVFTKLSPFIPLITSLMGPLLGQTTQSAP